MTGATTIGRAWTLQLDVSATWAQETWEMSPVEGPLATAFCTRARVRDLAGNSAVLETCKVCHDQIQAQNGCNFICDFPGHGPVYVCESIVNLEACLPDVQDECEGATTGTTGDPTDSGTTGTGGFKPESDSDDGETGDDTSQGLGTDDPGGADACVCASDPGADGTLPLLLVAFATRRRPARFRRRQDPPRNRSTRS